MPREELAIQASAVLKSAKQKLKWMDKHPDRYDQSKKKDMQQYLNMLIKYAKEDKKNTRSAKRAAVLTSLKVLLVSIIPQSVRRVDIK